ncbi:MAG TPA: hypothetical protein VLU54_12670 [Casimicrobiaceae bacterium]|nr:hypothetical protein [Casimicrobiaceae bacterium]
MKRALLVSLLAALLGGCVIVPWGYGHHGDEHYRDDGHHGWHDGGRWNGYHDRWPGG